MNDLIVKIWVYFGYNYPDPSRFIRYIADNGNYHFAHLMAKFNDIYDRYGSDAVMNRFYAELGTDARRLLVEYAVHFYAPKAFNLTEEQKKELGINH